MGKSLRTVKMRKRRHRMVSIEKQIADKARAIQKDGMAEIIRTATLIVVGQKLDEIRALLQMAGVGQLSPQSSVLGRNAAVVVQGNMPTVSEAALVVQHPCSYCGRESVYRTRPHRFNRQGTWLCQAHYPLRRQHESAATAATNSEPTIVASEMGNGQPQAVVNGGAPLPPDKPDTGGDVTVGDAFAALGIQTNAQ